MVWGLWTTGKTWTFSAIEMEAIGTSQANKEYNLIDILTQCCVENRLKQEQGQKKGIQSSYHQ